MSQPADSVILYNKTMTLANTEYSQQIPVETKCISIHTREEKTEIRIAFKPGKVAAPVEPYQTVLKEKAFEMRDLELKAPMTIYFACGEAGKVLEITVIH